MSFLSPASASAANCNGAGALSVPDGGLLGVPGGGNGGGGSGGLYAAIGRKPTPMLSRKNTPELTPSQVPNPEQTHSVKSLKVKDQRGQSTGKTYSKTSSNVVKLPQIVHNSHGYQQPHNIQVQPIAGDQVVSNTSDKRDSNNRHDNNNTPLKYTKKKNVSFGEPYVVDDSWITDKWCKRGLSINALRHSIRKRFRRSRNLVSTDKQCSTETNEQDTEHQIPKKPPVHLTPILKAPKLANCTAKSNASTR